MYDITHYFEQLLAEHSSIDIAEAEFKKALAEDAELLAEYREWCHTVGSTEKHGFRDYADEYKEQRDSVWDSLQDYDDE
ncbi:MAG: hypothetical protein K2L93_05855 [Muribaculaceae bacterium]|nr:hypothetical protein [Muribaculaceae bacterium]